MRLLLVEDDSRLNRALTLSLSEEGYAVDRAFDGLEGQELAESTDYDAIILIDALNAKKNPGEVAIYRKERLVQVPLKPRISPHDPALVEALLFSELSGKCPQQVLLVGVVPKRCELGCAMSDAAHLGMEAAICAVLTELERLGARVKLKSRPDEPAIWWEKNASPLSVEEGLAHVPGHPR